MTLVLPFGLDQIASNSIFSQPSSSMPCVFDNDAFERDFESALIRDWTSDIGDYDIPAEESAAKTPSSMKTLKRRTSEESEDASFSKKTRLEPPSGDEVSSSSSSSPPHPSSPPSFLDADDASPSSSSSSSSSSGSDCQEEEEEEDASPEEEEEYLPRRRGLQMWNSRQRWKDERKRVMKMSVTKLAEIDDPELCLLRSVLINNTIKRLHIDIRNERQAKLRHRQQRMDLFASAHSTFQQDFQEDSVQKPDSTSSSSTSGSSGSSSSDFYDDNSCDEIFGLNEDFMRVVPDRRASSPVPPRTAASESMDVDESSCPVTTATVTCSIPYYSGTNSCDTNADGGHHPYYQRRAQHQQQQQQQGGNSTQSVPPSLKQILASVSSSGSHCATQYRTTRDCAGETSFPPRVPILDEVVYHSLLASLES